MWACFEQLSGLQTLFSISQWPSKSQLSFYWDNDKFEIDLGDGGTIPWEDTEIEAGKWTHLVLVNKANQGVTLFYCNGKFMGDGEEEPDPEPNHKVYILHRPPGNPLNSKTLHVSWNAWINGHVKHDHYEDFLCDSEGNPLPNNNYFTTTPKAVIGAAGMVASNPGYFFNGKIDEVLFIRRALSDGDVKGIYEMGNAH